MTLDRWSYCQRIRTRRTAAPSSYAVACGALQIRICLAEERSKLVSALMDARRSLKRSTTDAAARATARREVHSAKTALGERGPVWWTDGAPDYNRKLVKNTPYADWFAALDCRIG